MPRADDSVFDALAEAATAIGIRLHLARGSMDLGESDGGLPPDHVVEDLDAILASTERVIERHHDGERIVVTVAPCSPFSVTPELMKESAALARRHGLRLTRTSRRRSTRSAMLCGASGGAPSTSSRTSGGSRTTSGWRTRSTSTTRR